MKKSLKSAIIIIILVDFLGIFAIMFNQYLASLRLESINSTLIQIEYFKSNLLQLRLIANSPIIKEENSVQLFKSKISEIQHHQEELKTSLENLAVSSYSTPINDLYKSIHTYAEHFLTVSATSNAPLQDTKLLSLSRIINKQFEDLQTLLVPQIKTEYHDVLYRSLLIIAIFSSIVIIFSITNIRKLKVSLNNVNNMQKASDHEIHAYDVDELYYDEFIQMGKVIQAVVTKHALVEQEMENMLYFDELTELPNRFALSSSIEGNPSIKLMLVNINSFKSYNELYGNEVGNTILQEFAKVLKDFVKKRSLEIYRLHADIFALVEFVDTLNEEDYLLTIETLLHDINENPLWIESITNWIHVDVTIGISIFQDDPITKANMALEFAQNHAKQFMVYNSMIDRTTDHKNVLYWKDAIRLALKSDNIVPYFQPIVDPDGKTIKYEALMRMLKLKNLGNIEVIAPASFLDIAMKINIYYELTQAMIDKSLRAISMTDKELSFNLTFDDILNNDTMIMLEDSIQKYNIGKRLIFEIVESQTIEDMEKLKSFTERFKRLGVRFAIDDFGTGYSNFSNILTIKPDYIKIDGSLIKDMNTNESSFVLSKAIVEFSHQLGMKVIAEYVHSETIFDLCKQIGVDQFQGYHFAEPLKEI